MAHFDKHNKGMKALVDTSEALLNAMETNGIDPETVSNRPEFTVLVHFLKSIIDGELNIPNDLTDRIRDTAFQLDMDQKMNKKLN
jgi:hypothetical protein|tara:strand:+ start:4639 stop:4893 length:255 start_codon:yes stop_codon:yes gene_type:complete